MEKIENNWIIILKSEKISDLEKQKIFENSISSEELKKRLDKKIEIEAQKLRKNLEKRKNNIFVSV